MNREKTIYTLTIFIFLGMVGLYYLLYRAYQEYQTIAGTGNTLGQISNVLSSI